MDTREHLEAPEPMAKKAAKSMESTWDSFLSVESALRAFLGGYLGDDGGVPCQKYISDDARIEAPFRKELAKLLRNREKPLSFEIRELLADLFDHEPDSLSAERIILLGFRHAGNRTRVHRQSAIYQAIINVIAEQNEKPTRAIAIVADRFDLDISTVKRVWVRYRWVRECSLPEGGV